MAERSWLSFNSEKKYCFMNKKVIIPIFSILLVLFVGVVLFRAHSLNKQKEVNQEMMELAELDKKDMENEYQLFVDQ